MSIFTGLELPPYNPLEKGQKQKTENIKAKTTEEGKASSSV